MRAVSVVAVLALAAIARAEAPMSLDRVALEQHLKRAEETQSDALVIYQDGRLVGEWHFGAKIREPIKFMSGAFNDFPLMVQALVKR